MMITLHLDISNNNIESVKAVEWNQEKCNHIDVTERRFKQC